jgi:hypothetical protein
MEEPVSLSRIVVLPAFARPKIRIRNSVSDTGSETSSKEDVDEWVDESASEVIEGKQLTSRSVQRSTMGVIAVTRTRRAIKLDSIYRF